MTAISTLVNSISLIFFFKSETFEKNRLAKQQMYKGHEHPIRTSPKTFMNEVLFIGWPRNSFA
jgi:hypothetical protein